MGKVKKRNVNFNSKFESICRDIKTVKIQGATNVAKAALEALKIRRDKQSLKILKNLRPTEPLTRNILKFANAFEDINQGVREATLYFPWADYMINYYGLKVIKNNDKIMTHCHSSNVVKLLTAARNSGRKFEVYVTETRPLFQGRKTALDLAKAGIKVYYLTDLQARIGLKKCDIFLFGADAITVDGSIANKIGTELFVDLAKQYNKKIYCVTQALKFDPETLKEGHKEKLEIRDGKEVWDIKNKNIEVLNNAFEFVKAEKIDGIISEFGIKKINDFINTFKKHYKFLL